MYITVFGHKRTTKFPNHEIVFSHHGVFLEFSKTDVAFDSLTKEGGGLEDRVENKEEGGGGEKVEN